MSTPTFVLAARTGELAGQTRKDDHGTERISPEADLPTSSRKHGSGSLTFCSLRSSSTVRLLSSAHASGAGVQFLSY